MRRKVGENVGFARDQNHFLLESWYSTDMIHGNAKNVHMCIVLQRFGPVMWGEGGGCKFCLLKYLGRWMWLLGSVGRFF